MPSPHPVTWTPERIARFWSGFDQSGATQDWHFARQRGRALLRYADSHGSLGSPMLDLGCGSGHFLDILLARGFQCTGADVSPVSIDQVATRLGQRTGFGGAHLLDGSGRLPFDDNSFATLFMLETVEHLLPQAATVALGEARRVMRHGAQIVVTTPYREPLERKSLTCPWCGCTFHRTQHIHSFSCATMSALMSSAGFRPVGCAAALLLPDWRVWLRAQRSPAIRNLRCPECQRELHAPRRSPGRRLAGLARELRHLVYIGSKPA